MSESLKRVTQKYVFHSAFPVSPSTSQCNSFVFYQRRSCPVQIAVKPFFLFLNITQSKSRKRFFFAKRNFFTFLASSLASRCEDQSSVRTIWTIPPTDGCPSCFFFFLRIILIKITDFWGDRGRGNGFETFKYNKIYTNRGRTCYNKILKHTNFIYNEFLAFSSQITQNSRFITAIFFIRQ